MDMDRGKMRVSSYVLLSASAVAGATAYAVTRLLAKTALDREAPKVAPVISGAMSQLIAGSCR